VHGARVALPRFRQQRSGVLINMSSVWGRVTSPHVSAYVTSKHAVRAFSECLRHELVPGEDVHVATILPQAVDTPIFDNAANYGRRRVRPIPPISDPQKVADGILLCAESPKREVTFGRAARALELLYAFFPRVYCRIAPGMFMRGSFTQEPVSPGPGNVLEPLPDGHRVSGRWRSDRRRDLAGALLAAVRGGLAGLAGRR
jgi:short-subunit dehydrogenase